jgi:hypothetical protein
MIRAFKVFKTGITENYITILIPKSEFNDKLLKEKMNKYLFLGYTVKTI